MLSDRGCSPSSDGPCSLMMSLATERGRAHEWPFAGGPCMLPLLMLAHFILLVWFGFLCYLVDWYCEVIIPIKWLIVDARILLAMMRLLLADDVHVLFANELPCNAGHQRSPSHWLHCVQDRFVDVWQTNVSIARPLVIWTRWRLA